MKKKIFSTLDYLKTDIWMTPVQELPRAKAFFVRQLKVLLLAIRGFHEDQCSVKASALTFYSLLSVVPIVAMMFGIAKGFGFDKKLQAQLLEKFSGQEDVLMTVFEFSDSLLQRTKGGVIAGIGIAFLFWSVIQVLGNIEQSFNDIWKLEKQRSFARKFSDYLSVMLVGPVIFLMASSLTVTMAGQVKFIAMKVAQLGLPPAPILFLLHIFPYVLFSTLFAFLYIYMPNTKVHLRSGLVAGVLTGMMYQVTQWAYITFQVGVARNNAIYGSFAALPLFLIWLQVSWLIVLLGAELSFSIQNVDTYGYPVDSKKVSEFHKKLLSLLIARLVIRNFSAGAPPLTAPGIANTLGMPLRLVRRILSEFATSGLFTMTKTGEYEEDAYQPARDIHKISIRNVLDTLEKSGSVDLAFSPTEDFRVISDTLQAFGDTLEKSSANKLVIDL
jgi:membrane protein